MAEMRTVVFGGQPAGRTHRASWWKSHFGCKAWNTCAAVPLKSDTAPDDITTHDVDLQVSHSMLMRLVDVMFCGLLTPVVGFRHYN